MLLEVGPMFILIKMVQVILDHVRMVEEDQESENGKHKMKRIQWPEELKTGGDTTGTTPYYDMKNASSSYILVGEYFPAGSPMIGEIPTYASFRVFRDAAATNGTVSIRHVKVTELIGLHYTEKLMLVRYQQSSQQRLILYGQMLIILELLLQGIVLLLSLLVKQPD